MSMQDAVKGERRTGSERRTRSDAALAAGLLAALERREIEVLFQPQFAGSDNRLVGAEALARWLHPDQEPVDGGALFGLAARARRVTQVSRYVTQAALAAASAWPEPLRLSLNVSAAELADPDFAAIMGGALDEAGFPAARLTLEITEQSLVAELDRSGEQLRQLAARGIRIALDDFGAGFCNFGYLKRLPLHSLKLDRSMVEGIVEDPRDLAVLRGILAMAQALDLDVTAEGVEHEGQRAAIAREGCSAWQGFLGAEAMSAADFARLVTPLPSPAARPS